MEILGVGGWEMAVIVVLMLVVAGPQRMVRWAFVAGQYVAKLRSMWSEVMVVVQKEVDAAGLDVKVPTDLPTRQNLNRSIAKAFDPLTRPMRETLEQTKQDLTVTLVPLAPAKPPVQEAKPVVAAAPAAVKPGAKPSVSLGTWSGPNEQAS